MTSQSAVSQEGGSGRCVLSDGSLDRLEEPDWVDDQAAPRLLYKGQLSDLLARVQQSIPVSSKQFYSCKISTKELGLKWAFPFPCKYHVVVFMILGVI